MYISPKSLSANFQEFSSTPSSTPFTTSFQIRWGVIAVVSFPLERKKINFENLLKELELSNFCSYCEANKLIFTWQGNLLDNDILILTEHGSTLCWSVHHLTIVQANILVDKVGMKGELASQNLPKSLKILIEKTSHGRKRRKMEMSSSQDILLHNNVANEIQII